MSLRSNLVTVAVAALLCTVALGLSLPSCNGRPQPPLLVGTNTWLGYEPLFMARSLGLFSSQDISLLEFTSNTDSINAFRQGALDAACLTLDEALRLAQDGIDLQVVLVMDFSHGADVIIGQKNLNDFSDIKGRTIGVESTAVGAYLLTRALESHGLTVNDVTILPLEIFEHEQAFAKRSVDAVVTFEPVRSKLLAQGGQQLFDSSQIPGEIVDVLIVRSDRLKPKRAQLSKLIQAWFAALDHLKKDQADAVQRMTPRLALAPAEILLALTGLQFPNPTDNRRMLQGDSPGLAARASKLAEVMVRNGLLKKQVAIAPLLHADLVGDF